MSISLCMIVKNESDTIGRCLDNFADLFSEIIVVDTGSTDTTVEIVRRYTDKVFFFNWVDDFAAARNNSFSHANCDYIMWLDADDIISNVEKEKLRDFIKKLDGRVKQVALKYNVAFDENGNPTLSYYRERIFLRSEGFQWTGKIHEVIPLKNTLYEDIHIIHSKIHPTQKGRNLQIFLKMIDNGEKLDERQQFYYARELYYNEKYTQAIDAFTLFINNPKGWQEDKISACLNLSACYLYTDKSKAKQALFKSFLFDMPRGEILCEIGRQFFDDQRYRDAIYWYKLALKLQPDYTKGGFINPDCYGFIPNIQLCVCFDRLGDMSNAILHNDAASKFKPNSGAVQYNRNYFASKDK